MMELEYCVVCEEATGKAGEYEDSRYTADGDGPFCDGCFPSIFLEDDPREDR